MSFQFYANVIGFMKDNMIETLVASRLRLISVELFFWVQFARITLCRSSCNGLEDLFGQNSEMFFFFLISIDPDTILITGIKSNNRGGGGLFYFLKFFL